jgi:hypothetical protein
VRSADNGDELELPDPGERRHERDLSDLPWVAVGPDGAVNVVFRSISATLRVAALSHLPGALHDGGRSFERNIRLTDEPRTRP